jgi:hypothetical protein
MRGRVVVGFAEIASARYQLTIAGDHAAERVIALPCLIERHAHEALVLGRGFGFRKYRTGRRRGGGRERDDYAAAVMHMSWSVCRRGGRVRVAVIVGVNHELSSSSRFGAE